MKIKIFIFAITAGLIACHRSTETVDKSPTPATSVTLTRAIYGHIRNEISLTATTAYLYKSASMAPIAGYISKVRVKTGDTIKRGQPLYELESKEQHALSPQNISPITVCAGVDGIVLNVQQQAGDYVAEGNAVCTIADVNSYVFLLNVPYEQAQYVTAGNTCELLFPDGSRINAMTDNPLPEANTASQTLTVIVRAPKAPILPEGVKVDAKLYTSQPKSNVMVLPKKAVQCSEDLTCCWVMKLINDSTAVRIPVNTGHSNTDSIEVIGNLSPADRIVLTGAYALPDSSKITISHE